MKITVKDLQIAIGKINAITGSPLEPYSKTPPENKLPFVANVGNYHLSGAYSGWALHRMTNESGGIRDVFRCGHVSKKELYGRMQAYMDGLIDERETPTPY